MSRAEKHRALQIEAGEASARIEYDPGTRMWRGEILVPEGGADFCARDLGGLREAAETSLKVFLEMCREDAAGAEKHP